MQQKRSSLQIVFKDFACFSGTTDLRNNSFLILDHIHSMYNFLSEALYSQFNYAWCSSKKTFEENSCSGSLDKTGEVKNEGFTS